MGNNSIKDNLDKDHIISDILLSLGADIHHQQIFLIVEGMKDIVFWRNMLLDNVVIYESYSGKDGIEFIILNHFSDNSRVIGIRDRDYINEEIDRRIFFYDYCCLEMMLIDNNEAFNSIYFEYYKGTMTPPELRLHLLNQLKLLSLLRLHNELNHWGLNLKKLVNIVFNKRRKIIINDKIIDEINKRNSSFFNSNPEILTAIVEEFHFEKQYVDLLEITQGHDYLSLFAAISNLGRRKKQSGDHIEASLRCAYRKSDFLNTRLYQNINNYQETNDLAII